MPYIVIMRFVRDESTVREWRRMIRVCYSPSARCYESVGGKGITVCKRWRDSFDNFQEDMGLSRGRKLLRRDARQDFDVTNSYWSVVT